VYGPGGVASLRCEAGEPVLLTVTTGGDGLGTVVSDPIGIDCGTGCQEPFNTGTRVTLRAIPSGNDRFAEWSGACSGSVDTCTVTMDQAKSVTALFAEYHAVTVTMTLERAAQPPRPGSPPEAPQVTWDGVVVCERADAGVSECGVDVRAGSSLELVADERSGSRFGGWRGCDRPDEKTPPTACVLTVNEPRAVEVRFG
jgi:hypothetical protein